ncbi:MAG: hypothetical protein H0U17_09760 [Actinobacteria bacterium]|nr:hypothetical protein [Actinomycetota bacterium]
MNEADVKKLLGYRVRVQSSDWAYDGLEGKATGISSTFGVSLSLEVLGGRRWSIPLADISAMAALRSYRLVRRGAELPGVLAESDAAALLQAQQRASTSPGEVFEVWAGRRPVGWATGDNRGEAS